MTLVRRILPAAPLREIGEYQAAGGGRAIEAARRVEADAIIATIEEAGLRGRGGAGFPTGVKWRTIAANRSPELPTTVVVNGAEGEPGTFKDRTLLRTNPYPVLEGAAIAGLAVGASDIVVALKDGDDLGRRRVEQAAKEMQDAGMLAGLPVSVTVGPHHYLYGEETALLEVVDGRPPFPRIAPPYRRGVVEVVEDEDDVDDASNLSGHVEMAGPGPETLAPPALVDNVETLANVPGIVLNGAAWFRELGTTESPGTILCTVTGDVRRPGVGEVELGTSVRQAIESIAGGPVRASGIKAVLNGVSAAPLPPSLLDTPLTYEDMAGVGSGLGTASLIVVGDRTDMTAVAAGAARFLAIESCGQCTPCKADGLILVDALERLCAGEGGAADLDAVAKALTTVADGARCNLASQQQAVVGAIVENWNDELVRRATAATSATTATTASEQEPVEPMLIAEMLDLIDGEVALDVRHRDKRPDWSYDEDWSGSYPADSS